MTIDKIILQHSTRGMLELYKTYTKEYCQIAAKEFLKLKKGTVFLYTGFSVNEIAETDGPLGTYFLAKALKKLAYNPIIICDKICKNFFNDFKTLYLNHKDCEKENLLKILDKYQPICHFSIERCGRNFENKYTNAKNEDISDLTPPIDFLFLLGANNSPTFAIGDGGNEIGMGNFKEFIKNSLKIEPCIIKCDYPIIASVSNWGAYGFISSLQKFSKVSLLPNFQEVDTYLEYIVSLGAVDGLTKKNEKSVDGKDWEIEEKILQQLKVLIKNEV